MRLVLVMLVLTALNLLAQSADVSAVQQVKHLGDFQVIEFRRYTIKAGEREHFAQYFEAYFPEAMEQLGAIAFGQFLERENSSHFTWLRGFHDMDARAIANGSFYYGPLWKEHKTLMNSLMTDSDNVLLLRPLSPQTGVPVLPALDPIKEMNGAQGIVVAQLFSVKANSMESFARKAETAFAAYRSAGARDAGVLVTLDVANNFPQLPVRTDGPYLVWLGILKDNQAVEALRPLTSSIAKSLADTGLLRNAPELIILDPTHRSRLRWLP